MIKMDKNVFSGTNREAMISTLEGLRRRYGYGYVDDDIEEGGSSRFDSDFDFDRTVPRYFDIIGFNESWRKRFRNVFIIKKKYRPYFDSPFLLLLTAEMEKKAG